MQTCMLCDSCLHLKQNVDILLGLGTDYGAEETPNFCNF